MQMIFVASLMCENHPKVRIIGKTCCFTVTPLTVSKKFEYGHILIVYFNVTRNTLVLKICEQQIL